MGKRQLVRTLGLPQILMLGIGGTMGAGVFVLTGHAAGLVGPAVILVFFLAGLQSLPNSLSYAELASSFPVAGGGYAYISKATKGMLPFSVGWVSWFSSMFYAALSAVGAAYSLQVFLPMLPVPITAVAMVLLFAFISLRGSEEAGRTQVILAAILLGSLALFVIAGLISPNGFRWSTFYSEGGFFIYDSWVENMARIFQAITLVNVLFVGYEVIATTAEEAKNPGRNIPMAILGTILICAIVYCAVAFVALGVVPAHELGASSTPLSDVAARFLGGWGAPLMGLAGLIATITSLNTAMLSSARVALALSRDGYLPAFLARIHPRLKTPVPAIVISGGIIALAALSGDEVFLGYVSNFGYMFVVFFTNVSLILLRRKFPDVPRAFRTPWYPVTPILGCLGIIIVEAFTEWHALIVGIGMIAVGLVVYKLQRPVNRAIEVAVQTVEAARHEILVPLANPITAESLVRMAALIGKAREEATLVLLSIVPVPAATPLSVAQELLEKEGNGHHRLLERAADYAFRQGVPVRKLLQAARSVPAGIVAVAEERSGVGLILMGWQGQFATRPEKGHVVQSVLHGAKCDVAVLRSRPMEHLTRILVPIGGGPHSRLALKLAWEIAQVVGAEITALRVVRPEARSDAETEREVLRQIIEDRLGEAGEAVRLQVVEGGDIAAAILAEAAQGYDLLLIGASEEWFLKEMLFGSIPDRIADGASCSVLLVRKHEPTSVSWLRRRLKRIG